MRRAPRALARARPPAERCELCSTGLAHEHPHLVEVRLRQIVCACEACATLFDGMANGKYRRVSRRAQFLANFQMTDAQWETLLIPINMAFFFRSSLENRVVALYPSPAGAVESLLPMEAWREIEASHAALRQMKPDIEALLVNRVGHAHGLAKAESGNPVIEGLLMGSAFLVGALVPLAPFMLMSSVRNGLIAGIATTAIVLFAVGYLIEGRLSDLPRPWLAGVRFLAIALSAAVIGYLIGLAIAPLGKPSG